MRKFRGVFSPKIASNWLINHSGPITDRFTDWKILIAPHKNLTGLVTSKLDVFASIDRTVSQGFWLRDHAIFTSIYLNLRVVASISRSLQSRLNKRGSVALVSQIELNKREADSQYDTHVWILFNYEYFFIIMTHNIAKNILYVKYLSESSLWLIRVMH